MGNRQEFGVEGSNVMVCRSGAAFVLAQFAQGWVDSKQRTGGGRRKGRTG